MDIQFKEKLFKVLSRNDTGETNSHQSGISIPKKVASSEIFPHLGIETLNPRVEVTFFDENNLAWRFQYIYYNDIHHGKPRHQGHDEFRMTCVKDFIREYNAVKDVAVIGLPDKRLGEIAAAIIEIKIIFFCFSLFIRITSAFCINKYIIYGLYKKFFICNFYTIFCNFMKNSI